MEEQSTLDASDPELFDTALVGRLADGPTIAARADVRDRIKAELDRPGRRIVLVTGSPGAGKSTLMAGLAQAWEDAPRYFIRRGGEPDGPTYRHSGGLASFLTTVGLQLQARRPELYPRIDELTEINATLRARLIAAGGTGTAILINEVITQPFVRRAISAVLEADTVEGRATAVEIRRLVVDGAFSCPEKLAEPALLAPAEKLARDQPSARIVVLVDGLDELRFRPGSTTIGDWLTSTPMLPANVRLVVSSRPDAPWLLPLRKRFGTELAEVRIDHADEALADLEQCAAQLLAAPTDVRAVLAARSLDEAVFIRRAARAAQGNFLYLNLVVRALADGSGDADLPWLVNVENFPAGLTGLYTEFLGNVRSRVGTETWERCYRPVLSLLAVTRAPMTAGQMRELGALDPDERDLAAALETLSQFLAVDGVQHSVFHPSLADFLTGPPAQPEAEALHCDAARWHRRLTDHAIARHQAAGDWRSADPYLRAYLAVHATAAGRLDDLLVDPLFLLAAEPDHLLGTFEAATRARPIARIYQRLLPLLSGPDGATLAHLELYARQDGETDFADLVAAAATADTPRPWSAAHIQAQPLRVRGVLGQHDGDVHALAVTHDEDGNPLAVSGGTDGVVSLWDLQRGRPVGKVPMDAGVTALAASGLGDGQPVAVAGLSDGTVVTLNAQTRARIGQPLVGLENAGRPVAVGRFGGMPVALCDARTLRLWSLTDQTPVGPPLRLPDVSATNRVVALGEFDGHPIVAVAVQPDPWERVVLLWDARTGERIGKTIRPDDSVTALAVGDGCGALVVAVGDCDGLQVFDTATGAACSRRAPRLTPPVIQAIAIGVIGGHRIVVTGGSEGQIGLRDLVTLAPLAVIEGGLSLDEVTAVAIVPARGGESDGGGSDGTSPDDGGYILCAAIEASEPGGSEGPARHGPSLRRWRIDPPAAMAPGRGGSRLISRFGRSAPASRAWSAKPVGPVIRPRRELRDLATAHEADSLTIFASDGGAALAWDARTGEPRDLPVCGAAERVQALAVTTVEGRALAVAATYADDGLVRTWDVGSGQAARDPAGKVLARRFPGPVRALALGRQRDRTVVICAGFSTVHVWNLATGQPGEPGLFEGPRGIRAIATGDYGGRSTLFCLGQDHNSGKYLRAFDLDTGAELDVEHIQVTSGAENLALVRHDGRGLLVAGEQQSVRVWDPADLPAGPGPADPGPADPGPADPGPARRAPWPGRLVPVGGPTSHLAAVEVSGRVAAVCAGRHGEVRLLDLTGSGAGPGRAAGVASLGTVEVDGAAVVVAGRRDGVLVVDLATGEPAGRPPATVDLGETTHVATGRLAGRPIAVAVGREPGPHAWFVDTGEPLARQAEIPDERITALALGTVGDQPLLATGLWNRAIRLTDLESGQPIKEAITGFGSFPLSIAITTVADEDVVVSCDTTTVRANYLRAPGQPRPSPGEMAAFPPRVVFATCDETPPPPTVVDGRAFRHHSGPFHGSVLTLGSLDDQPLVIAGDKAGEIAIFALRGGLQLDGPPLIDDGPVTALAQAEMAGRPLLASGDIHGTVRIRDLSDLGADPVEIYTLWSIAALLLVPPEHCVIGNERGLIVVRLRRSEPGPAQAQAQAAIARLSFPRDTRSARTCTHHGENRRPVKIAGAEALRICVKGLQTAWGARAVHPLEFPGGHCYLYADRLVIEAARPSVGGPASPETVVLPYGRLFVDSIDDPDAHRTDGCHFGLLLDDGDRRRVLSFYRRQDRDRARTEVVRWKAADWLRIEARIEESPAALRKRLSRHRGGPLLAKCRFVALGPDGRPGDRTYDEPFGLDVSQNDKPVHLRSKEDCQAGGQALDRLCARLREDGWLAIETGDHWYSATFVRDRT